MNKLEGKVALVTGGAVGYKDGGDSIGSAIAFKLASEGAKVVIIDLLDKASEQTAERIRKDGGDSIYVHCDVSSGEEVSQAITKTKEKYGRLDVLVNCAARYDGNIFKNVVETPEEDWKAVIDVNLNGYFRFAKYGIPLMLENDGGSIVNISSMAAFAVVPNFAVYAVTKAAINGLTRVLAVDHAPKIRANAICPGFVKIANSENKRTPEELKAWYDGIAKGYPAKRVCTVDEIANIALFLASPDSSYVNGSCIEADGGRSIADAHDF